MALKVTEAQVMQQYNKGLALARRAKAGLEKADQIVDQVVKTTLTAGAAFGAGVAQGKTGGMEVMGVPVDLGGSLLLHGLGFAGVAKKATPHVHAIADGLLCAYTVTLGRAVGQRWASGGESAPALPEGGAAAGSTMSDRELAGFANR